jgi:hypothetical protein
MASIAEQWEYFRTNVIPPELDAEIVENARYTFYTGFAAAMHLLSQNDTQEQAVGMFTALTSEYEDYCTVKFGKDGVPLQ